MSQQVTTSFVEQYSANVQLLSQQRGSKLRGAVDQEMVRGKNAFFEQIGEVAAQKRQTRHEDTPQIDTPHARRRVSLADYVWADLIDNEDRIRMLIDPTSPYASAAAMAMGRSMDDVIISAATGTAYTGVDGSTATALPTTQDVVDSAGNTSTTDIGMTVAKLIGAKKILDENEVDESIPRFMVMSAQQFADLLAITQVTSTDYNSVKALVMGEINTFMGFNFIRNERLTTDASDVTLCFAWAADGIKLALGQDINAQITPRADKNYATQVYFSMCLGATRMEEKKVVRVYADNSPDA